MSALPVEPPEGGIPGPDASAAEIRSSLHPDDIGVFDAQWLDAMRVATRTRDLAPVHRMLETWRRHAIHRAAIGEDGWAALMARAAERLADPPDVAEALTWEDLVARRAARER